MPNSFGIGPILLEWDADDADDADFFFFNGYQFSSETPHFQNKQKNLRSS
jgi:hypothetical protein